MFTKTAKKLWVFISSAVASVCLAFGAIALPPANVAKAAIDGSLSEEVTLNKIVATNGITATGTTNDYISFDMGAKGQNVWIMTQFTGKNAPNYAMNAAANGLSTWTTDNNATESRNAAGVLLANSSEKYETYLHVANSANTQTAQAYLPSSTGVSSGTQKAGLGNMEDNVEYIQIIGYEQNTTSTVGAANITYYMFKIENGAATLTGSFLPKDDGTANGGSWSFSPYGQYVVLYGNIHSNEEGATNPESVTFQYAKPATTLAGMLKGVSDYYDYKDDIVKALEIKDDVSQKVEAPKPEEKTALASSATLNKIQATNGITAEGTTNQYVSFDMGTKGVNVWVMTQFTGKNAPNYAINAAKSGLATWTNESGNDATADNNIAGTLVTNSSEYNASYLQSFASANTASGKAKANNPSSQGVSSGTQIPGLANLTDGVEYIQIVGLEAVPNSTLRQSYLTYYMFKVENGVATLAGSYVPKADGTVNGGAWTLSPYGQYVVLYGNIHCSALTKNPDSVTFSYQAPKTTLTDLVNSLDNTYAYKDDIATALNITIEKVETKTYTATFEDLEGKPLKTLKDVEAVKLPNSTLADFVGWYNKADGKLYKAGEIVAVTANTTFVEVATGIALEDGAAVRLKNDVVGMGGLRFEAVFSKAAIDLLGDNVTLKGAVIPTDLLDGELTLTTTSVATVALENVVEVDGEYHAYITLTNIKLENFQREFSARAFATVTYADGSNGTVASAYDEEKNSRSIYEVAVKAYNSGKYGEHEMLKYYLDNTVNVAVEVVDTEYTVTTAHTYDGLKEGFVRGYTVSDVSRDGTTITFTVTLSGLTLTEEFSVTIWTNADSFETQIVTFTKGVATVNFTMAL